MIVSRISIAGEAVCQRPGSWESACYNRVFMTSSCILLALQAYGNGLVVLLDAVSQTSLPRAWVRYDSEGRKSNDDF